jgi:hypothetical protein
MFFATRLPSVEAVEKEKGQLILPILLVVAALFRNEVIASCFYFQNHHGQIIVEEERDCFFGSNPDITNPCKDWNWFNSPSATL